MFDWKRTMEHGLDLALDQVRKGQEVDDVAVMWALLCEAAQTSRLADSSPPRQGFPSKSAMPDAPDEISEFAKIRAYLNGEIEDMPETQSKPPQPTASHITRRDYVLWVWHNKALLRRGNRSRLKKAVYARACGVKPRVILARTGINRHQVNAAKVEGMQEMADYVYGLYKLPKCG